MKESLESWQENLYIWQSSLLAENGRHKVMKAVAAASLVIVLILSIILFFVLFLPLL